MLFGKPILILDGFPYDYYKSNKILNPYIFSDIDNLIQYMHKFLNSETEKQEFEQRRVEFLKTAYPHYLSGSGEIVVNLINKLIKE